MRVVLAGGAGLVGSALAASLLRDGHEVVVLSRSPGGPSGARVALWDGRTLGEWRSELEGAGAVVNLSGHPVFSRWNARTRALIVDSRIESTRVIGEAIAAATAPPSVWVNLSAVGYYGDTGSRLVEESSPPGEGVMPETCVAWERACMDAPAHGARKVLARMGVVLSRHGGALRPLTLLTKCFLGGHLADGSHGMSWVHEADAVGILRHAIDEPLEGPVNVVAPHPVSHREFMATLRKMLHRPWSPPIPRFAVQLAGVFGVPPADILLEGQYALPANALLSGYAFLHPDLEEALRSLDL